LKWQNLLRSVLQLSIQHDRSDIARLVYEKFGDQKQIISQDPYSEVYFQRYFNISRYLDNNVILKNNIERIKRERQFANKEIYKNFICHLLQANKMKESPIQPSLEEDFECPVCFELMCLPRRIFACHHGHLICSVCLACPKITLCPLCRDDFGERKPKRSLEAEEKVKNLQPSL
jgi:hypothetical protein